MLIKALADIPPFNVLPLEELIHLQDSLPVLDFEKGHLLMREGHADDSLYILLEGQVEIIKSMGTEEERLFGIRGSGTLLGEMSIFSQKHCHTASVRSFTPVRVLQISAQNFEAIIKRYPSIALEMVRITSRRLETSENMTILDLQEKNLQLQQAYEELKAAQEQIIEKERLEKELEISAQIQRSILPDSLPHCQGYDMGALMVPARYVGGDFYSYFELDGNRWGVLVGDVCDKGVPAALFMALSYSLIRAEAMRTNSPVETFRNVNKHLLNMNSMSLFVTLVYGILDCQSGDFHFARVAHPSPVLLDGDGQAMFVPVAPGQPLGLFEQLPIDEEHIHIPPGGTLLLYSDGVNEPINLLEDEFGIELIHQSMAAHRHLSAQEMCEGLWQDVQAFGAGLAQQDDFTVLVVKRQKEVSGWIQND
jgi:phosphoserine phosphatase RsbU/P